MSNGILLSKQILHIIVLLFLLLISACDDRHQPPLRIASSPWPGYEPLYLARDLEYFDKKKVNLFELPSSDITMESFRNSSADLATLTLDETLELMHDGVKLRILLALDISHGGDAVLARPEIKTLSDIRGKRIAIVNIPLGLYMLRRTLENAGVDRKDVTVFLMAETKQLEFYQQGKADVVITFDPVKARLIDEGAQVIFDSSQIPNEIFDLLVVHEDVYRERQEDICEIVKQWFRSLDYIKNNKNDAALRIARRLGVDVEDYDELMNGIVLPNGKDNIELFGGESPAILLPVRKLQDIMIGEKMLSSHIDLSEAIDKSFTSCYMQ